MPFEVEVKVLFARMEETMGKRVRRFYDLKLERKKVAFLPLHLTTIHLIDKTSPLHGLNKADLEKAEAEFLVLITAIDDTFSQTVHARSSYRFDEIIWNAEFKDMFQKSDRGIISVDLHRLHKYNLLSEDNEHSNN